MKAKIEDLQELTKYLDGYARINGCAPSIREIAEHFSVSVSTAHAYVHRLQDGGMIEKLPNINRGIETSALKLMKDRCLRIPLVGRIACGQPLTAIENVEEFITLSESLVGTGEFFMLQAYGDSMVEAGIEQGDLVIIRQQNTAKPGDIIVALMEDEATLKRFYPEPEKGRVRLHPENSAMQDIFVPYCDIQGVAVKVIKDAC